MNDAPSLPWSWLDETELQVFIDSYRRSGFTGGLNWYRSMDLKWKQRKPFENSKSNVPAYFLGSENDVDLKGFHGEDPISSDIASVSCISLPDPLLCFERTSKIFESNMYRPTIAN